MDITGLNLPTAVTDFSVSGNIAKVLGEDLFELDMELQLGETTGISKTISSPKVVTLNNKEAEIEQTTQIPYNTLDEAGNTITEFKEAPLKLRVTPQITPDNKLLLDIEVNDDTATTSASSEEPAIESKRIQSKLIVNDKETIVIGGIQRVTRTRGENRIPGAADVPVVGWLFKNRSRDVSKQELLVFIRCEVL
jgi:type IV pilus assembly protein PilQ